MAKVLQSFRTADLLNSVSARTLRRGTEILLVAILLVQGGRLVWLFAEPDADHVVAPRNIKADPAVLTRFDPFFGGASVNIETDSSGYSLFGINADGSGGGSAIIGLPDGSQVSVAVGESFGDGAVLRSVGFDHVTVARGESLSRIYFADAAPLASEAAPVVEEESSQTSQAIIVDPAKLVSEAGLRPKLDGVRIIGLSISAAGNAPELAKAGLQDGDVILSVNGTALTSPQALATLRERLSTAATAEISFARGGARQMTTIRTK